MAKYDVEIVEKLSRVVEIDADSYEDAEAKAEEMYDNTDIILDYEDKEDTDFKPYPSREISSSFILNIDFDKKRKTVYISKENSTGASYQCKREDDLISAIETYISNYINFEKVKANKEEKMKDKGGEER